MQKSHVFRAIFKTILDLDKSTWTYIQIIVHPPNNAFKYSRKFASSILFYQPAWSADRPVF